MRFTTVFLPISIIWAVAVVWKVGVVRSRREPYVFSFWDGGLMLQGKQLGSGGALAFGGFAVALAVAAGVLVAKWSQL